MSVDGKISIEKLRKDDSIVIKSADKGGSVVVMNAATYRDEAMRQLSGTTTYCKLRGDPTDSFTAELSSLLDRAVLMGLFTQKEKEMFIPMFPVMPIFHHLPKLQVDRSWQV